MAIVVIRIKNKGAKGVGSYEYKNDVTLDDFKVMAIVFQDLENYGANIEKIYQEYKKQKQQDFPF